MAQNTGENRLDQTWNKAYVLILNCNKILESIDQNQDLFTGGNYYAVKGEALALRAMLHFDMLRLFGPVYAKDSEKKAIPYYNKQTNSPEAYPHSQGGGREGGCRPGGSPHPACQRSGEDRRNPDERFTGRYQQLHALPCSPTQLLCQVEALLARVNLYMGNKTEAFKYATDVIKTADQGIFPFVDKSLVRGSPADPDRIFSSEVLFALTNTSRSKIHKNFYDPSRLPNYVFRMDDNLMSNIVYGGAATTGGYQDDYRYRANWIATGSNRYF